LVVLTAVPLVDVNVAEKCRGNGLKSRHLSLPSAIERTRRQRLLKTPCAAGRIHASVWRILSGRGSPLNQSGGGHGGIISSRFGKSSDQERHNVMID
jgi:hypothetical protein